MVRVENKKKICKRQDENECSATKNVRNNCVCIATDENKSLGQSAKRPTAPIPSNFRWSYNTQCTILYCDLLLTVRSRRSSNKNKIIK